MPVTWLDLILIVFMLISAFLAMARGFAREVLSLLSWIMAAVVALVIFPRLQSTARQYLDPAWAADIALLVGLFVIALIIISFITFRITEKLLDSKIGALDRSMGFVFGALRGLVLVAIGHLFFSWLVPAENSPVWIQQAKSKPMLDYTGQAILSVLPDDPDAILSKLKVLKDRPEPATQDESTSSITPKNEDPEVGYRQSERRGLDRLLESTQGTSSSQ